MKKQIENLSQSDSSNKNRINGLDPLLKKLKKADVRNRWLTFILICFNIILIFSLLLDFLGSLQKETNLLFNISVILRITGFGLIILFFIKYYKEYKNADYALPVTQMLAKAANRYKFTLRRIRYLIPSIFLIGIGLSLANVSGLPFLKTVTITIYFLLGFLILITVGILIGYFLWKIFEKPIYERIILMLNELQDESANQGC